MDWLYNFNIFLINWLPWLNFINDFFVLQFIIIYNIYLIYFTNNLYFILFYLFLEFIYFGFFLSIINFELFTAFLWLTECVVIFISIIFLFYLNIYSNFNTINTNYYSYKYYGVYFCVFIISVIFTIYNETEFYLPVEIIYTYLWDDYYESLNNNKYNDLYCLFISYYYLNSLEFIVIGLLLLFASIICVNINKHTKNIKFNNYYDFLVLFDFFNDFVNFIFLRKQNLNEQTTHEASIRFFKKKKKKEIIKKKEKSKNWFMN